MTEELHGELDHITYSNDQSLYTVAKLRIKKNSALVTIVGNLPRVSPGEILKLTGDWIIHPKYGRQFRINSCETVAPTTLEGLEKYLGSGLIKGIGPLMAKRLVSKFGYDTMQIIEDNDARLREVEGIGVKRIEMIRSAWEEQKGIRDIMIFLQGNEVGTGQAMKIYRHYGRASVRMVKENPYRLAEDIFGIGFLTADRIAQKIGVSPDSLQRAEAGIIHVMKKHSEDGHVFFPYEEFIHHCEKILGIEREPVLKAFARLVVEKRIITEDLSADDSTENKKAVYLNNLYDAETGIDRRIKKLLITPGMLSRLNPDVFPDLVRQDLRLVLSQTQTEAVASAVSAKLLVITGGPGTGKTTIVRSIVSILKRAGRCILLAAPTGRAAKRMAEATGHEARTIHRLLEYSPRDRKFNRNKEHRLDADMLVIDEASMIDTELMAVLLEAVPDGSSLILVGDIDQLPSVGPGNVLMDIIDSGVVPVVRLREIFRQSGESHIIVNAHRINRGEFPLIPASGEEGSDFFFFPVEEPEKVRETIVALCMEKIPQKFGLDPLRDIQVLTPMHKGIVGSIAMNGELQNRLNPEGEELQRGDRIFRKNDKVMQVRNNYERDVFNGDTGKIVMIDRELQTVHVEYDGRIVEYEFGDLDELALAYSISVHKAQGSEYPAVVIPILTQHYLLLQRNLLYTAITRGKKIVVLVGTRKAISIAIRNDTPRKRHSYLKGRLTRKADPPVFRVQKGMREDGQ